MAAAYSGKKKTSDYPVKKRQLDEDIAGGHFRPVYLICGEEAYLRRWNRDRLVRAALGEGGEMNRTCFAGKNIDPVQLVDLARTVPFFAERRVLLIENSGFFESGCPELADYLAAPEETSVLIFVETKVDRRTGLYKAMTKNNGFELSCDAQDEQTLRKWIVKRFSDEGKSISQATAAMLLSRVGNDMFCLAAEMEKLICYGMDRTEITAADVEAVCAGWITGRIFDMTDAIAAGDTDRALAVYAEMLAQKEPAQRISALIIRQLNLMLQAGELSRAGKRGRELGEMLSLHEYVAGKYAGWAARYRPGELARLLSRAAAQDAAVKTGRLDAGLAVEMLIIQAGKKVI